MRESRSYGSVGEPVGNHRLYPEEAGGEIPPPTRLGRNVGFLFPILRIFGTFNFPLP